MLYYLFFPLAEMWSGFNVFRYITFRTVYAALTAFALGLWLGPHIIRFIRNLGIGERIRQDGPGLHQKKAGTPTMGGLIILPSILLSSLLWARWENSGVWILSLALIWFGLIGFWDDYLKVVKKKPNGLISEKKMIAQLAGALILMGLIVQHQSFWQYGTAINVPFLKTPLQLPIWLYFIFGVFIIVGASNAVNLTDGLDGLAAGSLAFVAGTLTIMGYLVAHHKFAAYLKVIFVPGGGELVVMGGAFIGAVLGFLWYNSHPAEIFMGDTGSLSLGGALGTLAILIKQELLLAVVGGVFVAEALSVILQVASFRLTKKRIFLMAPLHHHFEMRGWSESKIIIRFWIVGILLAVLSLSTLKLR
jgi:phospho-N-acetylmuramoyl-pentapeptide-transferase